MHEHTLDSDNTSYDPRFCIDKTTDKGICIISTDTATDKSVVK